jgi:hypothetical protein
MEWNTDQLSNTMREDDEFIFFEISEQDERTN